jgi:DNA-binding response OmpR family regulator
VVEDEPDLIELYERYLKPEFEVRTATSGGEALERLDEEIETVLLDRRMPGISGDDVLEALRARGYRMPVAMVTGADPDADIAELPFDEYLVKPVDPEELLETVQLLVNRASFEQKSREFFRLASKKASLDTESSVDGDIYADLAARMATVQADLDDTISDLLGGDSEIVTRSTLEQGEIETLLMEVSDHTLPPDIEELVDAYQKLDTARPPFMWKWVHRLAPQNTLPCVDQQYTDAVPIDKTITILFITLLDDILEKVGDRATFAELSKIPFEQQRPNPTTEGVNAEYVRFARRTWRTLLDRIQEAPKYDDYAELLRFDMRQAISSIEYTEIAIQRPDLSTMRDLERYESHNMAMFVYADIDLMHSSTDVRDDLGTLREAIWTAQLMSRIGNWVSTWERELREGDYSSGPVVYALENGIISHSELPQAEAEAGGGDVEEYVDRIKQHGIEQAFLRQWEEYYHRLQGHNEELTAIDLEPFIDGTEEVLRYHLASTGLK